MRASPAGTGRSSAFSYARVSAFSTAFMNVIFPRGDGPRTRGSPRPFAAFRAVRVVNTSRPAARMSESHHGASAPAHRNDSPEEALAAFVAEVRAPPPARGPDPLVSVAFAMGWQMAELYRPDQRTTRAAAHPEDLPGLSAFDDAQLTELGLAQLHGGLTKLRERIEHSGQDLTAVVNAAGALREAPDAATRASRVLKLHVRLLSALVAADFRLGKAYGLGRALADTCRNPEDMTGLRREFDPDRVASLRGWIADLSSALPPHAGHSVGDSLQRWCKRLAAEPATAEKQLDDLLRRLRRQGALWRALLSGEKFGHDMLELSNYARAAESLFVRLRDLSLHFIGRFRLLIGLIVALFAAGVALAVLLDDSGSTAAGLGAIAASLGL